MLKYEPLVCIVQTHIMYLYSCVETISHSGIVFGVQFHLLPVCLMVGLLECHLSDGGGGEGAGGSSKSPPEQKFSGPFCTQSQLGIVSSLTIH